MIHRLQYISQETATLSHVEAVREACEAGCKWIQLRVKDKSIGEILAIGEEVRSICNDFGATLILNDYVTLATDIVADGVHVGKKDHPPQEVRQLLGEGYLIGATANTFEDIQHYALEEAVDYIGLGPFRFTTTKKELSPILGVEGYRRIVEQCRQEGIQIPIIAIGGIVLEDIKGIVATGVHGIAVSGLITRSIEKSTLVKSIYEQLNY